MKPKLIKPSEVTGEKAQAIPQFVFDAFNELIAKNWNGSSATFKLRDVADAAYLKQPGYNLGPKATRQELFDNRYFDVEGAYREIGWVVEFDGPAYNETYEATFTFRRE